MFSHTQQLKQQLADALANKGANYKPRTRYQDDRQRPIYTNRLILEDSPYLLQHAHNPVDWFAWGDAAFNRAQADNKPVFLSIGYSTCHWCHVMEEESFDNEDIAKQLNDGFVCIKVDRELHPDVDHFYMTCVMMMQGHGGWPMSSFLTPDRKPFLSGTYYQPGQFRILLNRIVQFWQQQHEQILAQATTISQQVSGIMTAAPSANEVDAQVIELAGATIMQHYDPQCGGFGGAPKFPNEPYLYFLLEYALYTERADILDAVVNTLHSQTCGGLYDQVAGGFHRYATDQHWLIPHFEKMLYNQANLAFILAQAYQITGAKDFKRTACETLDYVIREMTDSKGCFYSATDADSDEHEGLFFIWEEQEIEALLAQDAAQFISLYQVTGQGNFEGRTILHLAKPLQYYATEHNLDYLELIETLEKHKKILLQARAKRTCPLRDDKILTAWNGMMIKAFAYVGQQFNRQDYIEIAACAATALLANNQLQQGIFSRASLAGQASVPALQEDYAYLAEGLLQLYDASLARQWLVQAEALTEQMIALFWDQHHGGFFMAAQTQNSLLPVAPKEIMDNAMASGNSVALRVLVRLAKRTANPRYQHYAEQLLRAYTQEINKRPFACSYLLCGLLEMQHGEQANTQWCAHGNIYIQAQISPINQVTVQLQIAEHWHLSPIQDQQGALAPVLIASNHNALIQNLIYPEPMTKPLGAETKSVYAGAIAITFDLVNDDSNALNLIKLTLNLRACNDNSCLPLETVPLLLLQAP